MVKSIEEKVSTQIAVLKDRRADLDWEIQQIESKLEVLESLLEGDESKQHEVLMPNVAKVVRSISHQARRTGKKSKKPIEWSKVMDAIKSDKHEFSTNDIMDKLDQLGHNANRKSVRSRLGEYVQSKVIRRLEAGKYSFMS